MEGDRRSINRGAPDPGQPQKTWVVEPLLKATLSSKVMHWEQKEQEGMERPGSLCERHEVPRQPAAYDVNFSFCYWVLAPIQ